VNVMLAHAADFLAREDGAPHEAALAHFAAWLAARGLDEAHVGQPQLDEYLYHLALEGANSARLDQAVAALKGYFAFRASREGAPDPADGLCYFGETGEARERYIKAEWALSDAFYGIAPDLGRRGRGGDA